MVRVPVATGFVESDNDLGAELANNRDNFSDYFSWIGLHQRARIVILRRAGHARITIAEEPELLYSQFMSSRAHLPFAHLAQRFRRSQRGVRDLADLSACQTDQ